MVSYVWLHSSSVSKMDVLHEKTFKMRFSPATGTLDVRDYTKLISFYAQHNWWHNACELLAEMPKTKVQPNVYSFSAAITTCEKAGQWQHALGICQDMNHLHVVPNIITLNAVISSHGKGACWQPPLSFFQNLPTQDPTVLGGALHIDDAACIRPGGNPGNYSIFLSRITNDP